MNTTRIRTLTRRLSAIPRERESNGPADGELLTRFIATRDESAFEALVARHLPSVRAICRSVLHDSNDVDDAAQATFLVLVRRAGSVSDRNAIGAWLCRVAWRTANRLREMNVRRDSRQSHEVNLQTIPAKDAAMDRIEIVAAMNEEIGRLPEMYRIAVLMCYGAGTPTAEAAKHLGWPKGTLLTRLAWARKRLRRQLAKRGFALSGGFIALIASPGGVAARAILAGRIASSALALINGESVAKELVSERVSSLTEGVVRAMVGTKIKLLLGIGIFAIAVLGIGLGRMTAGSADAADKKLTPIAVAPPAKAETRDAAPPKAPQDGEAKAEAPVAPGNDLVVRRPLGSYTKEVPAYGKATFTFTESRLHIVANIHIEKSSFTITADADYSMNRESMVYGIITGVDVTGLRDEEEMAEIALIAGAATDMPFAFRVRTEDDAIAIKDIKFGPMGSPIFADLLGSGNGFKNLALIAAIVGGKYKGDPNPDRSPLLPAPRGYQPQNLPRPRKNPPNIPPGPGIPVVNTPGQVPSFTVPGPGFPAGLPFMNPPGHN